MTAKCQPQENTSMTIDDDKKLAIKPVKHAVASGAGRVHSATHAADINNFAAEEGSLRETKRNGNWSHAPVGHAVAAGARGVVAPAHAARVSSPTGIYGESDHVAENHMRVAVGVRDVAAVEGLDGSRKMV